MGTPLRVRLLGGFRVAVGDAACPRAPGACARPARWSSCSRSRPGHGLHREQAIELLWPDRAAARPPTTCTRRSTSRGARWSAAGADALECLALRDDVLRPLRRSGRSRSTSSVRGRRGGARATGTVDGLRGGARRSTRASCCPRTATRTGPPAGARRCASCTSRCCSSSPTLHAGAGDAAAAIEALQRAVVDDPLHEEAHRALMRLFADAGRRQQALAPVPAAAPALRRELRGRPRRRDAAPVPRAAAGQRTGRRAGAGEPRAPGPRRRPPRHNLPAGADELRRARARAGRGRAAARPHAAGDAHRPGRRGQDAAGARGRRRARARLPRRRVAGRAGAAGRPGACRAGGRRGARRAAAPGARRRSTALGAADRRRGGCCSCSTTASTWSTAARALAERLLRALPGPADPGHQPRAAAHRRRGRVARAVAGAARPRAPDAAELLALRGRAPVRRARGRRRARASRSATRTPRAVADDLPPPRRHAAGDRARRRARRRAVARADRRAPERPLALLGGGSARRLTRQQTLRGDARLEPRPARPRPSACSSGALPSSPGVRAGGRRGVCGGDGLRPARSLDLLGRLVDKSLVAPRRSAASYRYRLLETIRQYARERLAEAGETRGPRGAPPRLVPGRGASRRPGPGGRALLRAAELELDNLRAAVATGLRDDPCSALRTAVAMWPLWMRRGYFTEGSRLLDAALAAESAPTPLRARGLVAASALDVRLARSERLVALADEAREIHLALGDRRAAAGALLYRGVLESARTPHSDRPPRPWRRPSPRPSASARRSWPRAHVTPRAWMRTRAGTTTRPGG